MRNQTPPQEWDGSIQNHPSMQLWYPKWQLMLNFVWWDSFRFILPSNFRKHGLRFPYKSQLLLARNFQGLWIIVINSLPRKKGVFDSHSRHPKFDVHHTWHPESLKIPSFSNLSSFNPQSSNPQIAARYLQHPSPMANILPVPQAHHLCSCGRPHFQNVAFWWMKHRSHRGDLWPTYPTLPSKENN